MKKILLVLMVLSFATAQTRTNVWQLPQWGTGDTLRAGTKNSTPLSNFSLNNAFARIDSIGGVQIDSTGMFRSVYGRGTGNLTIDAGRSSATPVRIILNDSLYGTTNWQTTANLLVGGNATIGGYITVDSIVTSANVSFSDTVSFLDKVNMYGNLSVGGDLTVNDDATIGNELTLGSDAQDGKINLYNIVSGASEHLTLSASYIFGGSKSVSFENRSGIVALQTGNDSLQAPTVHAVLFASEKIAGNALNDTSALFTEWTTTSNDNVPIVRMKYLHKAGIKYVTARYYSYSDGDGWETQMAIGSLTQSDSGVNGSYGSTVQVNQLSVSGLTAGTLYDLQFKVSINTTGTSYFKELIITAESN